MSENKNPLNALFDLNEEQLAKFLASDPEFLKKATKAINEAKKKVEEEKIKAKYAQAPSEYCVKSYPKAVKLVESPYNEANEKALLDLFNQGLDPNYKPEGEKSLLTLSFEYLATKDRVELNWPDVLINKNAECDLDEAFAMIKLLIQRGVSSLGEKAASIPGKIFSRTGPWLEVEKKLQADSQVKSKWNKGIFTLSAFLTNVQSQNYSSRGFGENEWNSISQLAAVGCSFPASDTLDSYRATTFWQSLAALSTNPSIDEVSKNQNLSGQRFKALESRQEAFSWMAKKNWIETPIVECTDNLTPVDENKRKLISNRIKSTPTRAFISDCVLDESSYPIFCDLCDYEADKSLSRKYDSLGRSRLYFVNERFRHLYRNIDDGSTEILLKLANESLARGDEPASINAQSFEAKASNQEMADLLYAWHDKISLSSISSSKNVENKSSEPVVKKSKNSI